MTSAANWQRMWRDILGNVAFAMSHLRPHGLIRELIHRLGLARALIVSLLVATLLATVSRSDDSPTNEQVGGAITRSLDFIQRKGVEWIEQKKCVTCHQVPFMVWSLNSAADHGFDIDSDKLAQWSNWATDWRHFAAVARRDEVTQQKELASNVDILDQSILGRRSSRAEPAPWLDAYLTSLIASQQDDGSWTAGGQLPLQKRPQPETHDVTTMWTLYALASERSAEEIAPLFENAQPILERTNDAKSTEWWAVKLLLENQRGNADAATAARTRLLSHQHDDGGWGWLVDEESDAFGTGIAMYALARSGFASSDAAIANARQFLVGSQTDDGSWSVRSTKQAKRNRVEMTSTYWGTCWAVIGLLETLDH